uniref:rano class II histocompatibility antigen, A beta chain-like n=1 Tax=Scatophagus argus TaxID=75038 RepID=UPI001ED84E02|nr:rano class II histocompatibility antigen, A beta chain-like [Scatophagus argus]
MSHAIGFFTLLLSLSRADYYGQYLARCQFSSYDGHDAVYLEQASFNKVMAIQYNSTVGAVTGFTKQGKQFADILNKDPRFMSHQIWKTNLCKKNIPLIYSLLTSVEPSIWLRSVEAADSKHPGMLLCSVYNFYPKQIKVTWLRNGKEATSDVTSTEELPNGNWLYQIHSYLEFTPTPGEKITCMVQHVSLKEPKLYDWEPKSDPGMVKITVGAAGMLFGLVFIVAGLIYYKKSSALVLVPTTEVFYPEHTL